MYVIGNKSYEEDEQAKKEIDELNKIIFDKSDGEVNKLYEQGREVSIKYFQEAFIRLGTNFDRLFWESEMVNEGLKVVEEGLSKNILEKSDGAVIFKGEKYGLHTRVFVNSKGIPTYEAKELGLGVEKIKIFDFDKSIVITGNEQNEYFKVLLKAMDLLRPEVANKTIHIGHGMLRFASGKMSSKIWFCLRRLLNSSVFLRKSSLDNFSNSFSKLPILSTIGCNLFISFSLGSPKIFENSDIILL